MSQRTAIQRLLTWVVAAACLMFTICTQQISTPGSMTLADFQQRRGLSTGAEATPLVKPEAGRAPDVAPHEAARPDRWKPVMDSAERTRISTRYRPPQSLYDACGLHELWNDCSKLGGFLERMRAEPRDVLWASEAEERIERAVYEGERGQYRVRALECRLTRCVLEVVSESRTSGIAYAGAYDDGMIEDVGAVAEEIDPQTGIRSLVFVQIWQQRDTLIAGRQD